MPNLRHLAEKKIILHALMPSQSRMFTREKHQKNQYRQKIWKKLNPSHPGGGGGGGWGIGPHWPPPLVFWPLYPNRFGYRSEILWLFLKFYTGLGRGKKKFVGFSNFPLWDVCHRPLTISISSALIALHHNQAIS